MDAASLAERRAVAERDLGAALPGSGAFVAASKRFAELDDLHELSAQLATLSATATALEEMQGDEDAEVAALASSELVATKAELDAQEEALLARLLPQQTTDALGSVVEVRPSVGGEEAALFAQTLFDMYRGLAAAKRWRFEVLSLKSKGGGLKEGIALVRGDGTEPVHGLLQFEGGVHRVQRVPATESQGRVHTSTVSVWVLPEAPAAAADGGLDLGDVRVDVFRASGAGGQHVNTTESAVRVTHAPTGLTVSIQDERSQHQNKAKALKILAARVHDRERAEERQRTDALRASLVRSGDRSDKIRTYNFARDQCTDHRLQRSAFGLPELLAGSDLRLEEHFLVPLHSQERLASLQQLL